MLVSTTGFPLEKRLYPKYNAGMKSKFILVLLAAILFAPVGVNAEMKLLLNDLKRGDTSSDVRVLQQILNLDPVTKVASIGPGSPGYETMYFGSLTEAALKRFQKKYEAEIFALSGLSPVTGKLDLRTRTKMNTLALSGFITDSNITLSKPVEEKKTENNNYLTITSIEPENTTPGETVHLYGAGFTKTSNLYFGEKGKISFDFINSGHIKFKVPSDTELAFVRVSVTNIYGDTGWTDPVYVVNTEKKITSSSSKMGKILKDIERQNDIYTKIAVAKDTSDNPLRSLFARIFGPVKRAYAFSVNNFFGGSIQNVNICTCPWYSGVLLEIKDLASNSTVTTGFSSVGSTLHSNYNIMTTGVNVIGGTTPSPFFCLDVAAYGCIDDDTGDSTIDVMRGVGTSISGF